MAKELNIGDRVKSQPVIERNSRLLKDYIASHVNNRRSNGVGKIENYFLTEPRHYTVRHDPVKVKLSSLQEKEISQVAVYREDELFLIDSAGNPRKENALISWLRN